MEIDLASFLAPAGSLLGDVTQRVLEFLSVQDLIQYVAPSSLEEDEEEDNSSSTSQARHSSERYQHHHSTDTAAGPGYSGRGISSRETRDRFDECCCLGGRASRRRACLSTTTSPEERPLLNRESLSSSSHRGGGDEAGGRSRAQSPRRGATTNSERAVQHHYSSGGETGWDDREYGIENNHERNVSSAVGQCGGYDVVEGGRNEKISSSTADNSFGTKAVRGGGGLGGGVISILGFVIGLGLHPWTAVGALRGGVAQLLGDLLAGVPLLAFLRWAAGGASAVLGLSFRVALLPYDVTKGVVSYVVGSLEAMLTIATEIWCELRHLSLAELGCVVSCVVNGNSIPDFLLPTADGMDGGSGSSYGGGGRGATARMLSRSSRGTASLESGGPGYTLGYLRERSRSRGSGQSDDSCAGLSGSRGAWRQAHALRRRLDRVNRTASLVSYEERAESAVPRAKAQRVRRRMHYAMSLQCFQATVTVDGRQSPTASDSGEDDDGDGRGRGNSGGGAGSSSAFMCTPQSFPPTPVSRAHVMARTSQFADDILFLARDQLRLGENLKPGMDETTRATADFLRRQQRLAVLDGNNACEGIVLTCGHHRATKIGPSLYSSARAMVPVLRNRHVYFQVSCMREGPLAPSVGVGLSTPEMPLSTLVGAFSNSVGLCSTGQILMSSRWYGVPGEYAVHKNRMSTVGVLVYLDGSRSFRSWDGDMVRALVCFSVDGRLVRVSTGLAPPPPLTTTSATASSSVGGGGVAGANGSGAVSVMPLAGVLPPHPLQQQYQQHQQQQQQQQYQQQQRQQLQQAPMMVVRGGAAPPDAGASSSWPAGQGQEEIAPWEVAAASASASATAAVQGVYLSGGGIGGGATTSGGVNGSAAQSVGYGGGSAVDGVGRSVPTAAAVAAAIPTAAVIPTAAAPAVGALAALGLALPKDRDLFPTVTIHSANTEVLCRFCAEDLLHVTREDMGAPPGVPVYALDGSLINLPE